MKAKKKSDLSVVLSKTWSHWVFNLACSILDTLYSFPKYVSGADDETAQWKVHFGFLSSRNSHADVCVDDLRLWLNGTVLLEKLLNHQCTENHLFTQECKVISFTIKTSRGASCPEMYKLTILFSNWWKWILCQHKSRMSTTKYCTTQTELATRSSQHEAYIAPNRLKWSVL